MRISKLRHTLASLLALCVSTATHGQPYLCISDMATGFVYESKRWRIANFHAGTKYLIKEDKKGNAARANAHAELVQRLQQQGVPISTIPLERPQWIIQIFGSTIELTDQCYVNGGTLSCDGSHEFRLNFETMKFLNAHTQGYWNPDAETSTVTVPYIEVGTCSSLN